MAQRLLKTALVLAALCLCVFANEITLAQRYRYASFITTDGKVTHSTEGSIFLYSVGERKDSAIYLLRFTNDQPDVDQNKLFLFERTFSGVARGIFSEEEPSSLVNLKAGVVDLLQFQLPVHESSAVFSEKGISGTRYTTCTFETSVLQCHFDLSNFVTFAPGSNLEALQNRQTIQLNSFKQVRFVDTSLIDQVISTTTIELPSQKMIIQTELHRIDSPTMAFKLHLLVDPLTVHYTPLDHSHQLNPPTTTLQAPLIEVLEGLIEEQNQEIKLHNFGRLRSFLRQNPSKVSSFIESVSSKLAMGTLPRVRTLYSLLSSIPQNKQVAALLTKELNRAIDTNDEVTLDALLSSLHFTSSVDESLAEALSVLMRSTQDKTRDKVALTLGSVCANLPQIVAVEFLRPFLRTLDTNFAEEYSEYEKVLATHVLGNSRWSSVLINQLTKESLSPLVRLATIRGLRNQWKQEGVIKAIQNALLEPAPADLKSAMLHTVALTAQEYIKAGDLNIAHMDELMKTFEEQVRQELFLATTVWNDSSSELYDLISPWTVRNRDVISFYNYNAYLDAQQFGRPRANFRFAVGLFSGNGADGCLTGNFKIFDKIYIDSTFGQDFSLILDAYLYTTSLNQVFESRIYVYVFGRTILDIELDTNCTLRELALYDADIALLDEEAVYPIDSGEVTLIGRIIFGLRLVAGWKVCLLRTLEPGIALDFVVDFDVDISFSAEYEVKNFARTGIEIDSYFQYEIGPGTTLGQQNTTDGRIVCAACVGIYQSNAPGNFYLDFYTQRREGLQWGPKEVTPIYRYDVPAVPSQPIVETCSITAAAATAAAATSVMPYQPLLAQNKFPRSKSA